MAQLGMRNVTRYPTAIPTLTIDILVRTKKPFAAFYQQNNTNYIVDHASDPLSNIPAPIHKSDPDTILSITLGRSGPLVLTLASRTPF